MLLRDILAQETALAALRHALEHDRVAHAYLFEGPSGVGKQKAAVALACALLCPAAPRQGCGTCNVCERVLAGKHPDVRVLPPREEGSGNLPVEVVREEILPFAKFAPFEGRAACLIFPQADVSFPVQHAEAANALLKTLEEPRPLVSFVLTSERPERLLPTIRSRCQRVRFGALPAAVLRELLDREGIPPPARDAAVALAFGRADRALALGRDGTAEALLELALRVDDVTTRDAPGSLLELADEIARSDDRTLVLDTLALYFRDVAVAQLAGDAAQLSFRHHAAAIHARAATLTAAAAAERVRAIARACERIERNASPETTLDALLFSFATP